MIRSVGLLYNSLSDWASFEKQGLLCISSTCACVRALEPAEQLRLLFCAMNDVFSGRIICWHPPFSGGGNQPSQANVVLLGNLSEYVFLRDFVFAALSLQTAGLEVPKLMRPWIVESRLQFDNLPAYYQMKLNALDLKPSWLYGVQWEDVLLLFSDFLTL